MAARLRRLLALLPLACSAPLLAQGSADCAALAAPPAPAADGSCLVSSDPVTAIVYSQDDAQRLAGGRKLQLLGRLVDHLERWSDRRLEPAQRERLVVVLSRRLQLESSFVMTPDENGQVYMLQGGLAYRVRDPGLLLGLLGEVLGESLPGATPPAPPAPAPSPPSPPPAPPPPSEPPPGEPPPSDEAWRIELVLRDLHGGAVAAQRLDFSPSRDLLAGDSRLQFQAGAEFAQELRVRPETVALQALLRLDGFYQAPAPGGFVVPRTSVPLRWERPPPGGSSRQEVQVVAQQPVIATLLNMAGLDEDQLDAAADLVGLIATRLAHDGFTHFLQLSGQGRRVEMRSQAFFPVSDEQLAGAARQLLDDSVVDAGPLLPQLGGGLVQCRSTEIAPCWVVYLARRTFANRPSSELVARLRDLPQPGERVLVVELLGGADERPLYAEASARHLALALPADWLERGNAALEPLAERVVRALTAP
ncbi:MAG TPA: hypothetical protein VIX81_01770 [Gammaproteobacteria bacterium]